MYSNFKDKFNQKNEKNISIDQFIKSKEEFYENFEVISLENIKDEEKYLFTENGFYPIEDKRTKTIKILTRSKNLRRDLSSLKDKSPLKLLMKYARNNDSIYVTDNALYYDLVEQTSTMNKEYTEDEAQSFFNDLLMDANRKGASDIHIVWLSDAIVIKYRLDGKIVKQPKKYSKELGKALRNIFVNKSGVSEYEENEVSGQLAEVVDGIKMEYRLSIGPTVHGYVIVIRAESQISQDTNMEQWGYSPRATELIRRLFKAHHGIILVTGPTGSGKSTLLYTNIIEKINENSSYSPEILTVEDPVEIIVDGVNQVQVNTKGLKENWITFSSAIKMFLRQDPDMIVVGEIRDPEVAMQAVTAAKTGHLTASTLHTNDVKSTFTRLRELGIENSNIEDGVKGIISQQLLNKLCSNCKVPYEKNGETFYKRSKNGCSECQNSSVTGCKGRVPIVEIAELNNNPKNFLPENFEDYYSLEENIIYLIEEGIIDEEEGKRYIRINENENLKQRKAILDIWNKATKNRDFHNYIFPMYQPIFDDKNYIVGFETFMRMKNEHGEIINPKHFLALIKKMEMYNKFSMFILDQLIEQAKKMEKQIFWKIDEDNILGNENFFEDLLKRLEENEVKHKFTLMFHFQKDFKTFIQKCNDNNISIAINNFDANVKDIIFIERNKLKFDFIKTNADFVEGIHKEETWLDRYIEILENYKAKIIVDFIETKEMNEAVKERFKEKVFAFQGYGLRKPDYIEEHLKN